MEYRFAEGNPDRLPALAAELIALKPDVIVAGGIQVVPAAKAATPTIPIVAPAMLDPVGTGLITSLGRPGGNLTGFSIESSLEHSAKKLQLLKEAVPPVRRIAVVWNPGAPGHKPQFNEAQRLAPAMNLTLQSVEVRGPGDWDRIRSVLVQGRPEALDVWPDAVVQGHLRAILDFAATRKLPVVSGAREVTERGGLLSYATDYADLYRRAGRYVDRVLRGAKPADFPVEQPTKFELALNLKTARVLGLTLPPAVLMRADVTIERLTALASRAEP